MKTSRFAGLVFAAALAAGPVLAQTTTTDTAPAGTAAGGMATAPGTTAMPGLGTTTPGAPLSATGGMDNAAMTGAGVASHNPVLTDSGDVRASQVIGSSVYNDKNEKIGSVDDILLGKDQKAAQAVISVGGVLGVGAKLVTVPYEKLMFSDKVDSNTSRVMMPGTDSKALDGMPTYHYAGK